MVSIQVLFFVVVCEIVIIAGVVVLLKEWASFKKRTYNEVCEYLRSMKWPDVIEFFSEEKQREVDMFWTAPNFQEAFLDTVQAEDLTLTAAVGLVNSQPERMLAGGVTKLPSYRREQRARLELAQEYFTRMYYNNKVIRQWANTEWFDMKRKGLKYSVDEMMAIRQVMQETQAFRMFALGALVRGWFLSLLRFDDFKFIPFVPRIHKLRTFMGKDLLDQYECVKNAAAALSRLYGENEPETLLALM